MERSCEGDERRREFGFRVMGTFASGVKVGYLGFEIKERLQRDKQIATNENHDFP
jgi:hypothetical protein